MRLPMAIVFLLITWPSVCPADVGSSFKEYWSSFRSAVLSDDRPKVLSMTRFPFEVRGVTDSDPITRVGRGEFIPVYKSLVAQEVLFYKEGKVSSKTMLQVIRDNREIPAKGYVSKDLVRLELFEFKRIRGKWLFTTGYLELQETP